MDDSTALDPQARQEIDRLLHSGETLLWVGAPRRGIAFRPFDAILIPFSLVWGGFMAYWEYMAFTSKGPLIMKLWGVPFLVVALYFIAGRFFLDAAIRAKTGYALTDQRVLIVRGLFTQSTQSLPIQSLTLSLQRRSGGSGTILFGPFVYPAPTQWPGMASAPCFDLIPDAERVYQRIVEAQRAAS